MQIKSKEVLIQLRSFDQRPYHSNQEVAINIYKKKNPVLQQQKRANYLE